MINSLLLSGYRYILTTYTGAVAAFSLRKLSATYSGYCLKVRRSSDNTAQDVGFVNNIIDTASMLSFCGAGDGFIDTWYDQSGNSRNVLQATLLNQPQIVTSGSLYLKGTLNKPSIYADGSKRLRTATSLGITGNPALTITSVSTQDSAGGGYKVTGSYGNVASAASFHYPLTTTVATQVLIGYSGFISSAYYTYTNNTTLSSHIWSHPLNQTGNGDIGNKAYLNGVSQTLTSAGGGTPNLINGPLDICAWISGGAGNNLIGYLSEWIWWDSEFTIDQATQVYQNQNIFYGL